MSTIVKSATWYFRAITVTLRIAIQTCHATLTFHAGTAARWHQPIIWRRRRIWQLPIRAIAGRYIRRNRGLTAGGATLRRPDAICWQVSIDGLAIRKTFWHNRSTRIADLRFDRIRHECPRSRSEPLSYKRARACASWRVSTRERLVLAEELLFVVACVEHHLAAQHRDLAMQIAQFTGWHGVGISAPHRNVRVLAHLERARPSVQK